MEGTYYKFGELRKTALQMAIDSADDFGIDQIVSRAESYYLFLMGDA
jgi:hypothetical protein